MAAYLLCFFFKLPPSPDPHITVFAISQQLRMKLIAKSGLKPNYFTCLLINHYLGLVFLLFKESPFLQKPLFGLPNINKRSFLVRVNISQLITQVWMNSFLLSLSQTPPGFQGNQSKKNQISLTPVKKQTCATLQLCKVYMETSSLQLTLSCYPPLYLMFQKEHSFIQIKHSTFQLSLYEYLAIDSSCASLKQKFKTWSHRSLFHKHFIFSKTLKSADLH